MKNQSSIQGEIKRVCYSPHGIPEGVLLEGDTFVRIPPHTLLAPEKILVGTTIDVSGEQFDIDNYHVFHHARVLSRGQVLADDTLPKMLKERMKEFHKRQVENLEIHMRPFIHGKAKGTIDGIGYSPHGDVDRLLLSDGSSIHLAKDRKKPSRFRIGTLVEVEGLERMVGDHRVLMAETIKPCSSL